MILPPASRTLSPASACMPLRVGTSVSSALAEDCGATSSKITACSPAGRKAPPAGRSPSGTCTRVATRLIGQLDNKAHHIHRCAVLLRQNKTDLHVLPLE